MAPALPEVTQLLDGAGRVSIKSVNQVSGLTGGNWKIAEGLKRRL